MGKATNKQIQFLTNNKYFVVNWVKSVELKYADAELLCKMVSPYSDGNSNYYYRIRTKKEIWFPRLLNTLIEVAPKYGISTDEYQVSLNVFNQAQERKKAREVAKAQKVLAERRKEEIQCLIDLGTVLNSNEGERLPFAFTYLDGELEEKRGFDMIYLSPKGKEDYFDRMVKNNTLYNVNDKIGKYKYLRVYIEDMDEIAYLVSKHSVYLPNERRVLGLVVSERDFRKETFVQALEMHTECCPFIHG